jgi:SNF2 family DNA or RNA helicase
MERKLLDKINDDLEFFEHQITGVRQMARMNSFILADEMGLGKSLQALTVAAIDFEKGWADRILIVAPSFLKWNWAAEIDKQTTFTYEVYQGSPRQRTIQRMAFDSDILIVGYEQVTNDFDDLNRMKWSIVVVDEAHNIKGHTAKRTKAIHKLQKERIFLLTGSPVLNRANELWSLLHAMDPVRFRSYWAFVNRYCVFGGFKNKQIVGVKNKQELREVLGEYMIRRLKKDVLDLPDKQVVPVYVELHPKQEKWYRELEAEMALAIPDEPDPMEVENVLVKMLRLKQIAATPATIGLEDVSSKLDKACDMVEEFCLSDDDPERVVIFTQFRGVMEAMKLRLSALGVPCWQLHGSVPNDQRIPMVNEWESSSQPGVLMVMLQMGVGLNLTAARRGIFIDSLYVPKLNEQAEDRLHRIGADTTQPVQIFRLIAKGTVEERIEKILASKRHLFKTVVEDAPNWKEMLVKELKGGSE